MGNARAHPSGSCITCTSNGHHPTATFSSHPGDTQENKGTQKDPEARGRGDAHPQPQVTPIASTPMALGPPGRFSHVLPSVAQPRLGNIYRVAVCFRWEVAFLLLMLAMCGSEPANIQLILCFPNRMWPKQWTANADDISEEIKSKKSSRIKVLSKGECHCLSAPIRS